MSLKIIYLLSKYPSLTETFIAREINQISKLGGSIGLCILRPLDNTDVSIKAIMADNEFKVYCTQNIPKLILRMTHTMLIKPKRFFVCLFEFLGSVFRKPSRAHHMFYFFLASVWFSHQKEFKEVSYIHCHFLHSEAITTRWLSILLNIPYGITAHICKIRLDEIMIKRVVKDSSICIGDTRETFLLLKKLGKKKPALIKNGIDTLKINNSIDTINNPLDAKVPILILAVGSLIICKGFHILIKSCFDLKKSGIKFTCKIVGEGVERQILQSLIYKYNLEKYIIMPGAVSMDELIGLYKSSTIFVMPSIKSDVCTDGLPTVIIEAMAIGIPVIATQHAGIPDIVVHNKTGILIEQSDSEGLALEIKRLLKDQLLYTSISINGRNKVKKEYDLIKNSGQLFDLIQSVSEQ